MSRNLKALGLTWALILMGALMAATAQAAPAEFKADASTENANFYVEAESAQVIQMDFGGFLCAEVTGHGTEAKASGTATITDVEYSGGFEETEQCLALEAFGFTWDFNECDYRFRAGESSGSGTSEGVMDLVCPSEAPVELSIAGGLCTLTLLPQEGLGPVTYHEVEVAGENNDRITAEIGATNLTYEGHGLFCETGLRHNATYDGDVVLTAFDDDEVEAQVDATIEP